MKRTDSLRRLDRTVTKITDERRFVVDGRSMGGH
jgi:hypothetical protein